MNRVLLIDDELLVVEAIKCNVNWEACGVSEVFLCDNGFEAQNIMREHEIDLVISDIQMPGIDGLDFGKWMRESFPDTALLFISGYAQFEYARTAITLKAEDYVLKPVNYPALEERVKQIITDREKKQDQNLNIDFNKLASMLEEPDYHDNEESKDVIRDVINYIDSHIGEKVYRSQLADLVFYNENYLSRRFREEVGCSISTYIMEKRLEASKKLLSHTMLSVTEIGEKVGYDNTAYFIRIFKQQTGKTPNEFRKDRKSQENRRI